MQKWVYCRGCISMYSPETHVWQCCVTPDTPQAPSPSWVSGRLWARERVFPRVHTLSRAPRSSAVRPPAPAAPSWSWTSPSCWAPDKAGPPPPPPSLACARPYTRRSTRIPEMHTGTLCRNAERHELCERLARGHRHSFLCLDGSL